MSPRCRRASGAASAAAGLQQHSATAELRRGSTTDSAGRPAT
jgi:hypothetical protein